MSKENNSTESFAKSLYLGLVKEELIFPYPSVNSDESETIKMVAETISKFMQDKEKLYREFDHKGSQTEEYINQIKELGLFGIIIPEEFGGLGLSNTAYSRLVQELSRFDASTSLLIGAHTSIGMKGLTLFGTDQQKAKYLPKLATGETIAAFCLTEAGSGSDAASIKTKAEKQADGSWILNGEKIWITNGPIADFFTVFAKTDSPEGQITGFIVERAFGGVTHGHKEDKMGIRASATSTISFDNVRVPAENVLGEVGHGFKIAMSILNNGRTGLGGGCVGAMKQVIKHSVKQSKDRKQFKKSICEFELIKEKISQMSVETYAAESVVNIVSRLIDSGHQDYSVEAAMSKIIATEALWRVSYDALQIAGGNGFMREYPYERVVRDCRINLIFEGTNEILRMYVALSALKDVGTYLQEIKKGASEIFNDPIKGFGLLSDYASKKVTQITSIGLGQIKSINPDDKELIELSLILETYSAQLAKASEAALTKHRKGIVDQQLILKRLADISMDLFTGFCVISRTAKLTSDNNPNADLARNLTKQFIHQAKRRINQNLRRLEKNEDQLLNETATKLVELEEYPFDTI